MYKMKFKIATLISLILLVLSFSAEAQISYGGEPHSFNVKTNIDFDLVVLPAVDVEKALAEDDERDARGELYRYGIGIPVNLTVDNAGSWTSLADGGRIWTLKIKSNNALALGVYYSNFILPEGGELFLYNADKSQVIGSYNYLNNHPSGIFANELIYGDIVTLEYYSPEYVKENPVIDISEIAYGYRSVDYNLNLKYNDSDDCEVDAICSEGDTWRNQIRGVARISIKSNGEYGWCSGSLVNNTEENCLPYFLTADHCSDGASVEDVLAWIFYFNYERQNCNQVSEAEPSYSSITGAVQKARGGWNGSDFFLVMFTSYIPLEYNVHFSGWKTTNIGSTSGVGIHHPAGDIKKISAYTSSLQNSGTTHWSVKWAATTNGHGVTEGGSSGSPIFNSDGNLIGTLTGGYSACVINGAGSGTGPDQRDVYGKFSYSWSSNGGAPAYRLKDWLDPLNVGPTAFNGKDQTCTSFPIKADYYVASATVVAGTYVHFTNITLKDPAKSISYLWEFEGVEQSATTFVNSPNRTYNTPGIFPVTLTATSNGISDTKTGYITVQSNSIDEINNLNVSIFPNPAHDIINIEVESQSGTVSYINLFNTIGEIVKTEIIPADGNLALNIEGLPQGIYFARILNGEKSYSSKISVK